MKIFPIVFISLFLSFSVFGLTCNPDNNRLGFEKYDTGLHSFACNVVHCCSQGNVISDLHSCVRFDRSSVWDYTPEDQLIEDQDYTVYPDIAENGLPTLDEVEQIYIKRMDNTMNCASYRMKYQMNRELLKGDVINQRRLSDHIRKGLEKENQQYKEDLKREKCKEPSNDGDVTQQKKLDNATMHEQCVYEYYLQYYQNSVNEEFGNALSSDDTGTLNQLITGIFGAPAYAAPRSISEIQTIITDLSQRTQARAQKGRKALEEARGMHYDAHKAHAPHTMLGIVEKQLTEIRSNLEVTLRAAFIAIDKGQKALNAPR